MNKKKGLIFFYELKKNPYSINFYDKITKIKISKQCFKKYAIKRINIINSITKCKKKKQTNPLYNNSVALCINENLPLDNNNKDHEKFTLQHQKFQQRQIDHASHYILLLLCSRTVELREWFIKGEITLFRIRLKNLEKNEKENFVRSLHLKYPRATNQEFNECKKHDYYRYTRVIYKVPFELVSELVISRKILIKQGEAFIPFKDLDIVLSTIFEEHLRNNVDTAAKLKGLIESDFSYIFPLMDSLKERCQCDVHHWRDSSIIQENIRHTQVPSFAKYFPPCMFFLFSKLRENHHLKFDGRMQFGLYLKCGMGLSLKESLLFWEKSFFPRFNTIEFQRHYAYNIRHNYGKEGSRKDYNSLDCEKIQLFNEPSSFDHYHGCPFKHFSKVNLIKFLNQYLDQYTKNSVSSSSYDFTSTASSSVDSTQLSTGTFASTQSSSYTSTQSSNYISSPGIINLSQEERSRFILHMTNLVSEKKYCEACTCLLCYIQSNGHSYRDEDNEGSGNFTKTITNPDYYFQSNYFHFIKRIW